MLVDGDLIGLNGAVSASSDLLRFEQGRAAAPVEINPEPPGGPVRSHVQAEVQKDATSQEEDAELQMALAMSMQCMDAPKLMKSKGLEKKDSSVRKFFASVLCFSMGRSMSYRRSEEEVRVRKETKAPAEAELRPPHLHEPNPNSY